uniref:sugar transferase n=1 Tax=Bacillus infantis TaxID=324767 RepID=UPI0021E5DBBD|nr:sugar transferase [Bacillus infantis]
MKNDKVKYYYEILYNKRFALVSKRLFDLVVAILTLIILSPVFIIISIAIKIDSPGPIMFRQTRVTKYGKKFKIYKFRTMINNADKIGSQVTTKNDNRVTKVGRFLRRLRLDEIPQLLNIISGDMSFVGTRPEVVKYVEMYSNEMMATLLLPAGVTSTASINFKDEEQLIANTKDVDETYIKVVLPKKMGYNLLSIKEFSFFNDIQLMIKTVFVILFKREKVVDRKMLNNNVNETKIHK